MQKNFSYACRVFSLYLLCFGQSMAQDADVDAIVALQEQQASAWNRHDAAAYAALFADDADVVNVLGWWWRGQEELEHKLAQAFSFVFADSRLEIEDVHVRLLEPNYAVAHVIWELDGAKAPPGAPAPPRTGIQLQVLRRDDAGWKIVSFQNTNSIPEVSFPTGPISTLPDRP